jgi:hypothetical protein
MNGNRAHCERRRQYRHDHRNDYRDGSGVGDYWSRGIALQAASGTRIRTREGERPVTSRFVRIRKSRTSASVCYRRIHASIRTALRYLVHIRAYIAQCLQTIAAASLLPATTSPMNIHWGRIFGKKDSEAQPVDLKRHEEILRDMESVTEKLRRGDPLARMIRGQWNQPENKRK